jgi:Universal stress protein family
MHFSRRGFEQGLEKREDCKEWSGFREVSWNVKHAEHFFCERKEAMRMFKRILVPLDGSARAERALPVAVRITRAAGGTLVLAQVVSLPRGQSRRGDSGGSRVASD